MPRRRVSTIVQHMALPQVQPTAKPDAVCFKRVCKKASKFQDATDVRRDDMMLPTCGKILCIESKECKHG